MSATIDERVVEMRFNNKQFERGIQTSLSSLDKLKASLDMKGATEGFESIDRAAKKVNLNPLGNAVENVRLKFSALEVMAVTALSNITNKIVNAGQRIASEFTIEPVKTGFAEYETQLGAIQTILSNTRHEGTNLQQVNRALDELNTYSDKTIYNFTEMTRNIGTFTAAGVKLQTSVDSIKGIANLAAVSGSTSQQASTAMYQLSQALAAGKVSLMDWNSVVNAGMGGKVFQDALIRTSELLGTGADQAIKTYGSFRESLTQGEWLTTEVLTETLKQFAGAYDKAELIQQGFSEAQAEEISTMAKNAEDAATKVKTVTQLMDTLKESAQSGWTKTWQIIVGDFDEAKATLTEASSVIGDMIGKASDARNNLLAGGLSSGWKQLLDQGIADEAGYIEEIQAIAKKNGDAFEDLVKKSDTFSDALKTGLQEGLISSETLSEGIHNLQVKMSGMSAEELKAAGYTKDMVTKIEALDSGIRVGSISMDEFVKKIIRPSGRENVIDAIWNSAKGLLEVVKVIKGAFRDIFPPATADQLYAFTEKLKNLSARLTLSDEASKNLRNTFKGLFAIVDIVRKAFGAVHTALQPIISGTGNLAGKILGLTGSFGEWLANLNSAITSSNIFTKVANKIASVIEVIISSFHKLGAFLSEKIKMPGLDLLHDILDRIKVRLNQVGYVSVSMKDGVITAFETMGEFLANCTFVKVLETIWDVISRIASGIAKAISSIGKALASSLGNANFSGLIDLLNGASLGAIAVGITKFLTAVKTQLEDIGSIKYSFIRILDSVRSCFKAYQSQLKANVLLKIAGAIGILSAALIALSLVDSTKLMAALDAITFLFVDLMASFAVFDKMGGKASGMAKACTAMISLSVAVLVLASALKKISGLDTKELVTGLSGVVGLTGVVVATAKVLGKSGKLVIKGATQMVIFAAALKVLASVCTDLAELSWSELAIGLLGVGVLFGEISLFLNTAKFSKRSISTATGIVILSSAIKILASACQSFGNMPLENIGKGLMSIGGLLTELTLFTKATGNAKHVISTGVALIAISGALKIMASAVSGFATLSWDKIGRGLTVLAGSLVAITAAINFMPNHMTSTGIGLIAISAAMIILSKALSNFGNMNWDELARGLTMLSGSLAAMTVSLKLMTGTLPGSAALLVAATSLMLLAPVLKMLGGMSWGAIGKGLTTLAGAFAVIGISGAVLGPIIPSIIGLSKSIALLGLSVLGIGAGIALVSVGLSALSVALTALATTGAAGATAIVASLTVIITGIVAIIPAVISKLGDMIVAICNVIADSAGAIGHAVKELLLSIIEVLVDCIPPLVDGALKLIDALLKSLVEYTPSIIDSIFDFLIEVLNGIARKIPDLIVAAIDVLMAFFTGIVNAIKKIDTKTLLKAITGIGILSGIMIALHGVASLVPGAMLGILGIGAVIAELGLVIAAIGALAHIPGLTWLVNEGASFLQGVGTAIGKFVGGIVGGFMGGVSSQFPQIGADLSAFMTNVTPFIAGASAINPSMMDGVKALADVILILTAADILEGLTSWLTGGSSLSNFAEELVPFGKAMTAFGNEVKGIDGEVVANAAIAGKTLAEMAATLPNSGGVVGWFTGENDIDTFGEKLVPFGKAIKEYSDNVAGLNAEAITNSTTAGQALVELAKTLPNTGGVVSWFTGDNDIGKFGESLISFGKNFADYATYMHNVDSSVVTSTTNAASSLVELQKSLPKEGGWFSDDATLSDFGSDMAKFGDYFGRFYNYISGVDATALSAAINEVNRIADFAKGVSTLDSSGMANFAKSLQKLANGGIDKFVSTFKDASPTITRTAIGMAQTFVTAADTCKIKMQNAGERCVNECINGMQKKSDSLTIVFIPMLNKAIHNIKEFRPEFYNSADYLVEGFCKGISDNTYKAAVESRAMAKAASEAAARELDEHSPSKVGYRIGDYFGVAFVNAIGAYADKARTASEEMAASAKSGLNDAINRIRQFVDNDIDAQPTIRPVLDLSEVRNGVNGLSALLSHRQAIAINDSIEHRTTASNEPESTRGSNGNKYYFTQNNYSPKTLSRVEIYRHTKNQFSAFERMVEHD